MKIVEQKADVTFYLPENGNSIEKEIEKIGRTCYKSEDRITEESYVKFIKNILQRNHLAMIEFGYATARIICDRGISHELVRHRIASFAQESTRYCNYSSEKFDGNISFIKPPGLHEKTEKWIEFCEYSESVYFDMVKSGVSPQIARSVLPNCLKTEIVIGANLREWIAIFKLRCDSAAHPQMRLIMFDILKTFSEKIPCIFREIYEKFVTLPVLQN